ncbi:MAG: helicase [Peptococcaceae bacterium BICA1-7]|nr:MAG: helicase [Peptococcaceae bacterium BICA1-7]HBV98208.1 ATP-dependent helicase [Desulfotomaculum sp.]
MTTFAETGVNSKLIGGLNKGGITQPTEIQAKAIPLALKNKNVIGQSQTGSGKTLAYLLPLFQKVDSQKREMQAIILAPTHELVMQIDKQIKFLSENSGVPVTSAAIMGEVNITRQVEALREKPHIIVGSVGRILELISRKKINAHTVKTIVIDEGDRLLDQNNLDGVKAVIKTTMKDRQLMVFAAHIDQRALAVAKELLIDAEVVRIEDRQPVNPNISHVYFTAPAQRDKFDILRKLISAFKLKKAIVFVNISEDIQKTTEKLQYHNYKAYMIYGRASKEERQRALEGFRGEEIQLLVASDIAARGLDIKGVTHIFNLDVPEDPMEYLHRAGRTGRSGEAGTSVSIVTDRELALIRRYERDLNIKINRKEVFRGAIVDPGRGKPFVKKRIKKLNR